MENSQPEVATGGALAVLADPMLVEERSTISFRFSKLTWLVIGAVTLLCGLIAAAFALTSEPQYVVTREMFVLAGANPNDNDTLNRAFETIITERGFSVELKSYGGFDIPAEQIRSMISVTRPALSAQMYVSVKSPNFETADKVSAQIVPTLERMIAAGVKDLPVEIRIPGPVVQQIYQVPIRETEYTPWWSALLLGASVGFVLAFVVALFRNYRTPVISNARDVGEALDLPVLARVNVIGDGKSANPQDAVLSLLAAVERLGARGPIHRLVVVGPESNLERSKLVLALGCAFARNFDQPVALIDADLENSSLTKLIGANDEPGLAECLTGDLRVDQTLLRLENSHTPQVLASMVPQAGMVRVMPAGVNRGGSILRMRSNLHQVLGALSGRYVVIIDGPQVPGAVPTTQLLSMADATLVVVTEGSTSIRDARYAGDALRSYSTNPVGAVVMRK